MADRVAVKQLLEIVDRAYDRRSWHGTNLRGSLRGVTARQAAWRADVALLSETHRTLRATINSLSARDLTRRRKGSPFNNASLIAGVAAHDLYHAGQIQLIKRLRG